MAGLQQRLFFALRPPHAAALAIRTAVEHLRAAHAISGKWTKPENRHVTLQFLGTHRGVPQPLIDAAMRAAAELAFASFDVSFDRVWHFAGRRQAPCILLADAASDDVLRELCNALGAALLLQGAPCEAARDYTPHLTLAYGNLHAGAALAIEPIRWHAQEFVLVRSDPATGRHDVLARWPLAGRSLAPIL